MADLIDRDALLQDMTKRSDGISDWHVFDVINEQPAVNRWIPCSERLPDHYDDILFCERDRTIHKGYMYWDGTFIENHVKFRKSDIVAWMPLPEPPEKE